MDITLHENDIRQPKGTPQDILKFIKLIQFKNNRIDLVGSASLKSQRYFSDYDLFSPIQGIYTAEQIYHELSKILIKTFYEPDIYFIELKVQDQDGKKLKIYDEEEFYLKHIERFYENLDFVKIDFVVFVDSRFVDLSIIYSFNKSRSSKDEIIKSINNDIREFLQSRDYYKALKRKFLIYRNENSDKMLKLLQFFNSDAGKKYQTVSNLKTIKTILENYKHNDSIKRMAEINLKNIHVSVPLNNIDSVIKSNEKTINREAKAFF